jgi:carbon monoxide dehydrogenase subunit G
MPKISQTFTVAATTDTVWAMLQDVPRVVTCLPGLELLGTPQDNVYQGRLKVKLGAVTAAFEGEATIIEADAANFVSRIKGKGVDKKGGSRAQADFVYRLAPADGGTQVVVDADIQLSGPLAQFGRTGILNDVAHELTAQFAGNLGTRLAVPEASAAPVEGAPQPTTPPPVAAELSGGRLLVALLRGRWRALVAALRQLFGR